MLCNPNELCNSIKISNQIEWNFSSFYRNVFLSSVQRQILVWHGFSIKLLGVPCVHRIPLVNISVFFQITNIGKEFLEMLIKSVIYMSCRQKTWKNRRTYTLCVQSSIFWGIHIFIPTQANYKFSNSFLPHLIN